MHTVLRGTLRLGLIGFLVAISAFSAPLWAMEGGAQGRKGQGEMMRHKQVNVNTASARQIAKRLAKVGRVKARRIVAYREENGPFTEVDELLEVRGISRKILARNEGRIRLE